MSDKISVVINTYNASKYLERSLEAVKDFDEIVICDMESTDDTLDIARKYGCKIVTYPKGNHVSAEPARTFAIQSATSQWVLVVDSDEIVTPALKDYLYYMISKPDCPSGLYIPRKNYFMHHFMHSFYPDFLLRFFIREGTEWPPYVHTLPTIQGRIDYLPKSRKELAFVHLADDDIRTVMQKTNLYTDNEVEKKASKKYGIGALFYRPAWRCFRSYILKGGIRDGIPGLVHAVLDGVYQFILVAKIIEKRRERNGRTI